MRRKITSVFQYSDYRVLLLDDFTNRTTDNERYSLRSYARDLNLSPGYVSSVLKGKKSFNHENCEKIFSKLGFTEDSELEYIKKLIIYRNSSNALDKETALNYIKENIKTLELKDKSERDLILNSPFHVLIYMLADKISEIEKVKKLALEFSVKEDLFNQIIEEFITNDYISIENNFYKCIDKNIAITSSHKILNCNADLSQHLFAHMKKDGGIDFPEKSTHALLMGFDQHTFGQAIEVYKQFLHQIYRISQSTKTPEMFTVFLDLLYTKRVYRNNSDSSENT